MKKSVSQLAVLGGGALFAEPLHVGRPNIGNRDDFLISVNNILDRNWLTNNGQCVRELESRLAQFLGVKHCIAMCNATVALEITIRALELNGEVIIPSFTFIATAHSLQWQEITPVFCDVDPTTHSIDLNQVERMITPRTSGIIGVHLWGQPCDVEGLSAIAKKHSLKLMFDAAHAFACSHRGKMIGGFGNAEVFSFHATKFFNTFEGGAVATNDDDLAAKIRLMKNFGFAGFDNVIYIGTNGKMNEVSAAMGLTGLDHLDEFIDKNYGNYRLYRNGFEGLDRVRMITYDEKEKCNYQYIVLEIEESDSSINRDQLQKILQAENVLARRYFYPGCHRMEPYRSYFPHAGLLLPETERLTQRVLILPTGSAVSPRDIESICDLVRFSLKNGGELKNLV